MRVLRVADVPRSEPGGMNGFISNSGSALEARGHQVDYLLQESLIPRMRARIRRLIIPWAVPGHVLRAARTGRRYDLIEIHEPLAAGYCLLRRWRPEAVPPVAVLSFGLAERGWRAQTDRWRRLRVRAPLKSRLSVPSTLLSQARYAIRHADQVIVPNDGDLDFLEHRLGVDRRRVARANTGVGESFFSVERHSRDRAKRILCVGSWIDRKGTRELVEGWRRVAMRENLSLALVGVGIPASAVIAEFPEELRSKLSVRERVSEPELLKELARADVFVLMSWFEGMPLATLEAAASGLPCIVTAIPGHLEIFRPSDSQSDGALLVPPHDAGALAAALERVARDPQLAQRLGAAARARAHAFTWADTAEQLEVAYLRAIEAGRRSPAGAS